MILSETPTLPDGRSGGVLVHHFGGEKVWIPMGSLQRMPVILCSPFD